MKVKMLVSIAGADFSAAPGEVIEVDDADGARLIESGQAEAAKSPRARKTTNTKDAD